jgi:hypothetical protein
MPLMLVVPSLISYMRAGRGRLSDVYFIGHSLGGLVGAFITPNLGNEQVMPRVTALDPAGTTFTPANILDSTDATFVDVIRTSAGIFGSDGTTPDASIGTVDFYPNGGFYQKTCSNGIKKILIVFAEYFSVCIF